MSEQSPNDQKHETARQLTKDALGGQVKATRRRVIKWLKGKKH